MARSRHGSGSMSGRALLVLLIEALALAGAPVLPRVLDGASPAVAAIGDISTIAGNGNAGSGGDGGPATSAQLWGPFDTTVDPLGNVYISDSENKRIRKVDTNGNISTFAGTGTSGYSGDGGAATSAKINQGSGQITSDAVGNIFFVDAGNRRIRRIAVDGTITTVAGNGDFGDCDTGNGGQATAAALAELRGLAFDAAGNLYFTGTCHRVRKVDTAGILSTVAGTTRFGGFSGDGGAATAALLNSPRGLGVDGVGNLYVADEGNYRVRRIDTAGIINTVAGNGSATFSGDGGPATSAGIGLASDVQVDGAGSLFIGRGNDRIRKVDALGTITTVAGNGTTSPINDGGPATSAALYNPSGVVIDIDGDLLIADTNHQRIRRVEAIAVPRPIGGAIGLWEMLGGCNPTELCDPAQGSATDYPVNTATGNFWHTFDDLLIPGRGIPLELSHTYNSAMAGTNGPLGYGWTHSYQMALAITPTSVTVVQENASQVTFTKRGTDYWAPPRVLATLVKEGDGTYTFTRRKRDVFRFDSTGKLTSMKDLNNYTTTLAYDGSGRLSTVTDPANRTLTFAYDGSNRVISVTDTASPARVVSFAYDAVTGNMTQFTNVAGGVTVFTYDASHRLLTMTDPRNGVVTNEYDLAGRVTRQTDPMNRVTQVAYTAGVTTITDPKNNVHKDEYYDGLRTRQTRGYGTAQAATWTYSYDPKTIGITQVKDPLNHTRKYTYDGVGNVLTAKDGLDRTTTYTYSNLNDVLTVTDPTNVATTFTYDAAGNLQTESRPLVGSGTNRVVTYLYADAQKPGDVTGIKDPNNKTTNFVYDQYGNRTEVTDPVGNKAKFTYDGVGRMTTSIAPKGNVQGGNPAAFTTTYATNAWGDVTSVTDPLSHVTAFLYDGNRNRTRVTDPNNHQTNYTYNADDELTAITRADTTTLGNGYDANGNLTSQTDGANQATTYTYDPLDRVTGTTDPNNRTTGYGHDAAGNRITITQPGSMTTTLAYDNADQLTSINYSDPATPDVTFTYNANGQRLTMADGTGTTTYTWDSLSRMTSNQNGGGQSVGYGYDIEGRLTTITYPGNKVVTRGYDDADRLTSVQDWLTNTTSFTYDPNSNLTGRTSPNTTTVTNTYDNADRLNDITHKQNTTTFASFTYTRDNAGLLASTTPTGVTQPNETYTHTPIDQLATVNAGAYTYDPADNLTQHASGTRAAYDNANQLCWTAPTAGTGCATPPAGATTYAYDNRGNRSTTTPAGGSAITYGYDQANRLTTAPTASYAYNGDGLRTAKTVSGNTTNFLWNEAQGLPLLLSDGNTNYIYGPGGLPIEHVTGTTPTYYHQDQLGSTRLLTDSAGATIATYTFDAYGNQTTATGTATTPLRYAGEYRDDETGFYYLRARYYDPATSQFLSRDPIAAATRRPHLYGDNSPLTHRDPAGLVPIPDDDWIKGGGQAEDCDSPIGCFNPFIRKGRSCGTDAEGQMPQPHPNDPCDVKQVFQNDFGEIEIHEVCIDVNGVPYRRVRIAGPLTPGPDDGGEDDGEDEEGGLGLTDDGWITVVPVGNLGAMRRGW